MTRAVHYNAELDTPAIVEWNRVAHYCGAITHHATPQPLVRESRQIQDVTCKSCQKRFSKEICRYCEKPMSTHPGGVYCP